MAILRSHGILLVDSIPTHTPTAGQAKLARLDNSMTFYYYNDTNWISVDASGKIPSVSILKTITGKSIGDYVKTESYYVNELLGGADYVKVDPTALTSNDMDIIETDDGSFYQMVNTGECNPYQFGVRTLNPTDTSKLQRFFDYCFETKAIGNFKGIWEVDATIIIQGTYENVYECGRINAISSGLEVVLDIRNNSSKFNGDLRVQGTTAVGYASRNSLVGITRENSTGGRNHFQSVTVRGFKKWGIISVSGGANSTILDKYDNIQAWNCGSGNSTIRKHTFDITGYTNTGNHTNNNQRSVLDVLSIDSGLQDNSLLVINERVHYIVEGGIDEVGNTLTVYPWIDNTIVATVGAPFEIESMHGGGIDIFGQNSASMQIGQIDAIGCGSIVRSAGLYGADIGILQGQFSMSTYTIGRSDSNNNLGGTIGYFYGEAPRFDIVQVTKVETNTVIGATSVFRPEKVYTLNFSDNNNTKVPSPFNVSINYQGNIYTGGNRVPKNRASATVNYILQNGDEPQTVRTNSKDITLKWREDINGAWGHEDTHLQVWGTGVNLSPTGTITFELDSTDQANGITVMGGTTFDVSEFLGVANFAISFDHANQNWEVVDLTNVGGNTFALLNILDSTGGSIDFKRVDTTTGSGDLIGEMNFSATDSGVDEEDQIAAIMRVESSGIWGSGSIAPAEFVFLTKRTEAQVPAERLRIKDDGLINISNAPVYADDTAAGVGGLDSGDIYQTALGVLMIKQ